MNETHSQTESILDIVRGIDNKSIMLPEFQRDFRWELSQTHDLFDSLIRDIFIGTIIYGKPSFSLTLREIDKRPRKEKGSNSPLELHSYSTEDIKKLAQTKNLRIVLDGQQRITSLYRAITGIDTVYVILSENLDVESTINSNFSLEDIVAHASVESEENKNAISLKLSDVYDYEIKSLEDEDLNQNFANSMYGIILLEDSDKSFIKANEKLYRQTVKKILDLYKQQKMVAYYLLDMDLEKFCTFFERSNSRGIQLNFTDILAAKLYGGFNLRKEIEEFENQIDFKLNREILIRAIAYIVSSKNHSSASIEKQFILKNLEAKDFKENWQSVCDLYNRSLNYLIDQYFIVSQSWMSSENMIIPLMMYLKEIKGFENMNESQREFIEYWYWASVFSNRYSTSSNEIIVIDCDTLTCIAKSNNIKNSYFSKLRSKIVESADLFSYNKKSSAIYRGIFNLLTYEAKGTKDWNSSQKIKMSMQLEDHHIYPRGYINGSSKFNTSEIEQLVDCVVNRTLIPKITNIRIGKKSPYTYLSELQEINPNLSECLLSHLISPEIISHPKYDDSFKLFLDERAQKIFELIDKYASKPSEKIIKKHSIQSEETDLINKKPRLRELFKMGKILIGDRVYVKKHSDKIASIIDSDLVNYDNSEIPINKWAQDIAGWSSINIYTHVILERTGETLNSLRD